MTDAPSPRDVITKTCRGEIEFDLPFNAVADDILAALTAAGYVVEKGWQPIETKPDRPMPVLYLHTRLKWTDTHGNPATFGAVRDAAERTTVGFWNGRKWYQSGTGHDVFEDWHDIDDLPTHWRPLPA